MHVQFVEEYDPIKQTETRPIGKIEESATMKIKVLREEIKSGREIFPIFVGFVSAKELLEVAEVPNFQTTTPNCEIATNVLTPPVTNWQRPLMEDKKDQISQFFNGSGKEFMPNPVLLAERAVGPPPKVEVKQELMNTGEPTGDRNRVICVPDGGPGLPDG